MQITDLQNLITVEDIKKAVPQKDLMHIAFDDTTMSISDEKIQQAINISVKKLFTKLMKCEKTSLEDWEIEIARLYLIKDAIYQLHTMNETESLVQDKLIEARQILKDWLGDCGKEEPKKITTVKVVKYEPKYRF